ncbi:hypothetical protein EBZ70_02440 [bacterium]|nr:hypothetical protein [bacterium]
MAITQSKSVAGILFFTAPCFSMPCRISSNTTSVRNLSTIAKAPLATATPDVDCWRSVCTIAYRANSKVFVITNAWSAKIKVLSLATAVEEPWLKELFPADYREERTVVYDSEIKRVITRRERRFRDLVLEARVSGDEAPLGEAALLLTREVVAGRIKIEAWDETVEQWILRVNRMAEWFPELEVNPLTEADRPTLVEQLCYGELGARAVKDKGKDEIMAVLRDWLTAEQLAVLDDYLPERLTMANGRKAKLEYAKEGPPVMAARIQELYGIEGRFTLGRGRVPVKIHVLAPNYRPIQVTDDLTSFWRDMYPTVKTELSRRYPRHEWR